MNKIGLSVCAIMALSCVNSASFAQGDGINLDRVLKSGARQFDRLDVNHDGFIDQAEWTAYVDAQIARLKERMAKRWAEMDVKNTTRFRARSFLPIGPNGSLRWMPIKPAL